MEETAQARPGVLMTLLILVGIAAFMAPLLGLFALAGISQPMFGFLFLLYWGGILKSAPDAFWKSVVGAIGGILLAAAMAFGFRHGVIGAAASLTALAVMLFCYMRQQFTLLFNNALTLYLTVASIPALDSLTQYPVMIGALLIAAFYIGACTLAIQRFQFVRQKRSAPSATTAAGITPTATVG